MKYIDGNE